MTALAPRPYGGPTERKGNAAKRRELLATGGIVAATPPRPGPGVRWTYLGEAKSWKRGRYIRVRCACGFERTMRCSDFETGNSRQCRSCVHRRHGATGSPTHTTWHAMHQRCSLPTMENYRYYGGRGITVCDRWSGPDGFANFLADMGERPEGMTLDRIDVNGDYCKENCRWATRSEQTRNSRSAKLNEVAVDLIRYMRRRGARLPDLAHAFGIAKSHAASITRGEHCFGGKREPIVVPRRRGATLAGAKRAAARIVPRRRAA